MSKITLQTDNGPVEVDEARMCECDDGFPDYPTIYHGKRWTDLLGTTADKRGFILDDSFQWTLVVKEGRQILVPLRREG